MSEFYLNLLPDEIIVIILSNMKSEDLNKVYHSKIINLMDKASFWIEVSILTLPSINKMLLQKSCIFKESGINAEEKPRDQHSSILILLAKLWIFNDRLGNYQILNIIYERYIQQVNLYSMIPSGISLSYPITEYKKETLKLLNVSNLNYLYDNNLDLTFEFKIGKIYLDIRIPENLRDKLLPVYQEISSELYLNIILFSIIKTDETFV